MKYHQEKTLLGRALESLRSETSNEECIDLLLASLVWLKLKREELIKTLTPQDALIGKNWVVEFQKLSSNTRLSTHDVFSNSQAAKALPKILPSLIQIEQSLEKGDISFTSLTWALWEYSPRQDLVSSSELEELVYQIFAEIPGMRLYVPYDMTRKLACRLAGKFSVTHQGFQLKVAAAYAFLLDVKLELQDGDPLGLATPPKAFGGAVAFPPFGHRRPMNDRPMDPDLIDVIDASPEAQQVSKILKQTEGLCVILVPSSYLAKTSFPDTQFKRQLLDRGRVKTVIDLPPGACLKFMLPTSLLLLDTKTRHDEVHFIDSSGIDFFTKNGSNYEMKIEPILALLRTPCHSESSIIIPVGSVEKQGLIHLQAARHVLRPEAKSFQLLLDQHRTSLRSLYPLVEMINCQQVKSKDRAELNYAEITVSDLPDFGYCNAEVPSVTVAEDQFKKAQRFHLQHNDVLLCTKGSAGKVGIYQESQTDFPVVPSQSFVILRPKYAGIDGPALYMYLQSEPMQAYIKTLIGGSSIPVLSTKDIENISIIIDPQLHDQWRQQFQSGIELQRQREEIQRQIESCRKLSI
jgi:Type I restriction modification DNA specificity domain/N-6 DNA Methylase